jgi:hypothetical protein
MPLTLTKHRLMLMTRKVCIYSSKVTSVWYAIRICSSFRGFPGKIRRHLGPRRKAQVAHSGPLKRVLGFLCRVDLRTGGPAAATAAALVLEPLSAGPLSGPKLRPDMSASIPLQYS